jgi:ADP-ribose pyrophosphatase YjhB (NUDIX family)
MRELPIVLGLIQQGDDYLLQYREGDPSIGAVNMIGCFGGKIEDGESPEQAVCRELNEETTLQLKPANVSKLGRVIVTSDHQLEQVKVIAHVYSVPVGSVAVRATEGCLVVMGAGEVEENLQNMTPGTRAAFKKFILSGK